MSALMKRWGYYLCPVWGNKPARMATCLDLYSNEKAHWSADIALPINTPLYAPRDCVVGAVYDKVPNPREATTGTGKPCNLVILWFKSSNGNWYSMGFHHLSQKIPVKAGQRLKAGQRFGYSHITGNTSGPHLHMWVGRGRLVRGQEYLVLWNRKVRVWGKGFDTVARIGKTRSQVIKPAKVSAKPTPSKPKVRLATVRARAVNRRKKGKALPKPSAQVKLWQKSLTKAGFRVSADGDYGPKTVTATKRLQRKQGWSGKGADGLPGKQTLNVLKRQGIFTT